MSYYTERLKPVILKLIEEGEHSLNEIASMYGVSPSFVAELKKEYLE